MTQRFAVIGNPISHSLSPRIHQHFARLNDVTLDYHKLEAPTDGFTDVLAKCHRKGYQGLNITLPFKYQAFAQSESLSERASLAGAVNTLSRTPSGWHGDNTDGFGLVNDLRRIIGDELSDRRVLVFGAGGSVAGILPALISEQTGAVHIANRTAAKAIALAADTSRKFEKDDITGSGLDFVPNTDFDILINATASGINGDVPQLAHTPTINECCYDLFYAATPTAFISWCEKTLFHPNLKLSDGLGMLVAQAAGSFSRWHDLFIDEREIEKIYLEIRKDLTG